MKRLSAALCVLAVVLAAAPAYAAKGSVAVIPVHTFRGNPDNGEVILAAVRAGLEREGFDVLAQNRVDEAVRSRGYKLDRHLSAPDLSAIRTDVNADFVVYARVLGVGEGLNDQGRVSAVILLNVVGKGSKKSFVHTRQLGQPFQPGRNPGRGFVIPRSEADNAAGQLLAGFFAKVK